MAWYYIVAICVGGLAVWLTLSALLYRCFFKRFYDIVLSGLALIVLLPLMIILTVVGAIVMKGNPFFTQLRPGKIKKKTGKERLFKLIKFRTMTCEKNENGELLPDEKRLVKYGKVLRATSLDELPELINIFIGDMSIVGPRPLLVKYLPYYNDQEKHRHDVRPGLTGFAQTHGRNCVTWEEKFSMDIMYVQKITLFGDVKIIIDTFLAVLRHSGVSLNSIEDFDIYRKNQNDRNTIN